MFQDFYMEGPLVLRRGGGTLAFGSLMVLKCSQDNYIYGMSEHVTKCQQEDTLVVADMGAGKFKEAYTISESENTHPPGSLVDAVRETKSFPLTHLEARKGAAHLSVTTT